MTKPLLLLDVDGVLNPYIPSRRVQRKYGYQDKLLRVNDSYSDYYLQYQYNPQHNDFLQELRQHFELTWCTAWSEMANEVLLDLYGIPPLPVVPIRTFEPSYRSLTDISHKTKMISRYVEDRPFAWVDDIARSVDRWYFRNVAPVTQDFVAYIIPAEIGLQEKDIDFLVDWSKKYNYDS